MVSFQSAKTSTATPHGFVVEQGDLSQTISRRKQAFGVSTEVEAELLDFLPFVQEGLEEIIDAFLQRLSAVVPARELWVGERAEIKLRELVGEHVLLLFKGEFDVGYLNARSKLDRLYNALGVTAPILFVSAYTLGTILEDHLARSLYLDTPPSSVRRIIMFDLQSLFETSTGRAPVAAGAEQAADKRLASIDNVVGIEQLAYTDDLTGLRNRRSFAVDARNMLESKGAESWAFCLVFIDLDDFKTINDKFGHCEGDRLLKEFSDSLTDLVGKQGMGYRYGGDEFCILLPNCSSDDAEKLCKKIGRASARELSRPLSFSAGIVSGTPGHLGDVVDLVAQADQAMYRAKRKSRASSRFFEKKIKAPSGERANSTRCVGMHTQLSRRMFWP